MSQEFTLLLRLLTKLPGMGPRSSKRAIFDLVKKKEVLLRPLLQGLQDIYDRARVCRLCHHLDTQDPCMICMSPTRCQKTLCVVEESLDVWTMERVGLYDGLYHVLGGTLSAMDNVGPEQLGLESLFLRIQNQAAQGTPFQEVTLALSATIEGQTTMHYILDMVKDKIQHIFTLAQGIPLGGNLDYLDDGTIAMAFKMRRHV